MDPQANSSFIPKQNKKNTVTKKRVGTTFPLFAVVAYALFIGSILAAAAIFVFNQFTIKQLTQSVGQLDQAITNFRYNDLQNVLDFNNRINVSKELLNNQISIVGALEYLERLLIQTVAVDSVSFEKVNDTTIKGIIELTASEIDFLIFQRDVVRAQDTGVILSHSIANIAYKPAEDIFSQKQISFELELLFSTPAVRMTPSSAPDVQSETVLEIDPVFEPDSENSIVDIDTQN
jgi:hypothetical protein